MSGCVSGGDASDSMRSLTFSQFSSAMPSAGNARWRPSTKGCNRLPSPTCALFERDRLPARSTLSRFLASLTQEPVEALRSLFLDDLLSRPLSNERQTGDLVDREGAA